MSIYYPKLRNMVHAVSEIFIAFSLSIFIAFKGTNIYGLCAITAAGVVLCSGPKKSLRTSSIVLIILYFCPLRSVGIFGEFKGSVMSRTAFSF